MNTVLSVPRLYTDEAGDSRFDTCAMTLTLQDHAPPAAPFFTTEPAKATSYTLFRLPSGWIGAQHRTPNYRLVICLSGSLLFIGSTGETLILNPGDRMMDMDTSGKGHATEVVSAEPVEGIIIRVD